MEVLKFAHATGCPWATHTSAEAALRGDLEMLKWLKAHDAPSDGVCAYAAFKGHLEVLKWARENGCKMDALACIYAVKGQHFEVLKWLERARVCLGRVGL